MFCEKCGKELAKGSTFCENCGTQVTKAGLEVPKVLKENPLKNDAFVNHLLDLLQKEREDKENDK